MVVMVVISTGRMRASTVRMMASIRGMIRA
jgi:hypothetical protein